MRVFPQNPQSLLPHRPPLLLLDAVDGVDSEGAWGSLTLRPGHVFLNAAGVLERVAFAEIMAQCFAAFGAARQCADAGMDADTGAGGKPSAPAVGYLAALRDVRVLADAHVGDTLHATARATATLGGITVVEGVVRRGEEVLATGQCKIFVPPVEAGGGEQGARPDAASTKGQDPV